MKIPAFITTSSLVLFGWLAASYTQELSESGYALDAAPSLSPGLFEAALKSEQSEREALTAVK
ncbi:MAG: hypothetical protein Q7Q71_10910 [Verrucomicrobiota bacterium JB023]|nr:hypothetical protein [Verrucomicrobiota bacterium JB023]